MNLRNFSSRTLSNTEMLSFLLRKSGNLLKWFGGGLSTTMESFLKVITTSFTERNCGRFRRFFKASN